MEEHRRPMDGGRLEPWPALPPLEAWRDAYATLHLWLQLVGKIRLALAPMLNHWWQVTLYVSARGLTTSAIPHHTGILELEFDFIDHQLLIRSSGGAIRSIALEPRSVADFTAEVLGTLKSVGVDVKIWTMPQEIENPIPFEKDEVHAAYDGEATRRLLGAMQHSERVMAEFRSGFLGKCSPVHFFWGGFDIALTRFSGRRAPEHPGGMPHLADRIVREAYSHEVSSCGFWPGGDLLPEPVFYAYAYPEPAGYAGYDLGVDGAYFHPELREFILPYDAVRRAAEPDALLGLFLQRTYEASAELGKWDRQALERPNLKRWAAGIARQSNG